MKDRRFLLAVVSALMAAQHNTGEAAATVAPDANREYSVHTQASSMAEQEAIVALFDDCRYEKVIETATAIWPRLEAMPDRVLYCVAECYIRTGQVRLAKTSFELLVSHSPQNHSYRAGLAYTLIYAGEVDKGLTIYRQVLNENHGMLKGAAEDAVALLAQGNYAGGKSLFRLVIAISPDKQYYLQWYEKSLRMYRLADDIPAVQDINRVTAAKPAVPSENEQNVLHSQALELAKNGQAQQALDIMASFSKSNNNDQSLVFDYIIISQQAGQNDQAVNLYERHSNFAMPFSVSKSVSKAYFQLKKYDKAMAVLEPAIFRGEHDALLWAGEMNLLRGNQAGAQLYYERLLAQNPNDFEVYFSRGMLSIEIKDYRQAAGDLERARRTMTNSEVSKSQLPKLEHSLALAYMNSGQNQKAVSLLKSYVKTSPVDSSAASYYIIALANSSQYELAVQEGERLWPAYAGGTTLGLRALAESYIRLGKKEQALAIHQHLARPQPGDAANWQKVGFQLLLAGRTAEGLSHYDKVLGRPANVDAVVTDAITFINTDKYLAGKMLFELVLSKYPKQAYREQYAEALVKKNFNQAAYKQYQLLSEQPDGELAGLSGMARTAIAMGDYTKSRQALDTITNKYGRSKAVAALEPNRQGQKSATLQTNYAASNDYQKMKPRLLSTTVQKSQDSALNVSNLVESNKHVLSVDKEAPQKIKEEFAYEMAQIATKFLSSPTTNAENFKIDFTYAISNITAKVIPIIPSEQRNQFTYEMAQITTTIINDNNLDMKKAQTQFAQLTTKIINQIDKIIADGKSTGLQKSDKPTFQVLNRETYSGLIDELMDVGNRSKHPDNKVKLDGEIRYHYAVNSGSEKWNKTAAGFRLYLSANSKINKDWHVYSTLEGQQSIKNYNNKFELSSLYIRGKLGDATVKAGKFGYLMAEGNIYDSSLTGVKLDAGEPVKYSVGYGKTQNTKETYIVTARYTDFDYNLETGLYYYQLDEGTHDRNTIVNIGGNYNFNDLSVGAMFLGSSRKDSKGNTNGYVLTLSYGQLHTYRPNTYNLYVKYYDQPQYTYISHGMDGKANSMQGFKGYGLGINYAFAKDSVLGIEYYDLKDKISGERGKTFWTQLTHYF